jgi:hypothetical protein
LIDPAHPTTVSYAISHADGTLLEVAGPDTAIEV